MDELRGVVLASCIRFGIYVKDGRATVSGIVSKASETSNNRKGRVTHFFRLLFMMVSITTLSFGRCISKMVSIVVNFVQMLNCWLQEVLNLSYGCASCVKCCSNFFWESSNAWFFVFIPSQKIPLVQQCLPFSSLAMCLWKEPQGIRQWSTVPPTSPSPPISLRQNETGQMLRSTEWVFLWHRFGQRKYLWSVSFEGTLLRSTIRLSCQIRSMLSRALMTWQQRCAVFFPFMLLKSVICLFSAANFWCVLWLSCGAVFRLFKQFATSGNLFGLGDWFI